MYTFYSDVQAAVLPDEIILPKAVGQANIEPG